MKTILKTVQSTRHLWPYYAIILISSLLLAMTFQIYPFIAKTAVDLSVKVVEGQQVDFFIGFILAILWFGADILNALFLNCVEYSSDILSSKLKKFFGEEYYRKLLNLPYQYHIDNPADESINSLKESTYNSFDNLKYLLKDLHKILAIFLSLIIIACYSLTVSIVILLAYAISVWLSLRSNKAHQQYQEYEDNCNKNTFNLIKDSLSQIKVVKSFVQEKRELLHLKHKSQQCVDVSCVQSRQWCSMDILRRSVISVILFIGVSYIFWQTFRSNFSIGEMILLLQFMNILRGPLLNPKDIIGNLQRCLISKDVLREILNFKPQESKGKTIKVQKGKIVFKGVSFKDSLKNVSFKIKPGAKLSVIAKDMQSSTAITDLLMRLFEPSSGSISIDDIDISTVRKNKLREHITFMDKNPLLFNDTIRQNIAYSRPDATDKIVHSAAKSALIDEDVESMSRKYNTYNPELSDNQKYRVLIARAFLKNSPILIIHEPEIRLDAKTKKALALLEKGRTTISITNSLKRASSSDAVLILKNGKIDECDNPRKLSESGGTYSKLLSSDSRSTDVDKDKLISFNLIND